MKLLLIEPANKHAELRGNFRIPPLSLGVLAGLTPEEWEVTIVQEPMDPVDFDENWDLVGITAATNNVLRGYEVADRFRERGIKVVMGGIHPTVLPDEALLHCDAVCIGEGESVWGSILSDATSGTLKNKYKQTRFLDLRHYTPPRRSVMPVRRSFFFDVGTVETTRGCPYHCEFCSVGLMHGNKVRTRPLTPLLREIESIENDLLFFVDNNVISNKTFAKKLFREMIPMKKRWVAQSTISIAGDKELLKLASESGCFGLLIGLENITRKGFTKYNKSLNNLAELKEALRLLKEHGISVLATMVFGNDGDDRDTLRESLDNLLTIDLIAASLGMLIPYPGTQTAAFLERENRILTKNWDLYDINNLVFKPKQFSCAEFREEMRSLRRTYFSWPHIVRRTVSHRQNNIRFGFGLNVAMRLHNVRHRKMLNFPISEDELA